MSSLRLYGLKQADIITSVASSWNEPSPWFASGVKEASFRKARACHVGKEEEQTVRTVGRSVDGNMLSFLKTPSPKMSLVDQLRCCWGEQERKEGDSLN